LKILLTHSPEALANYYGERALAGLRAVGEVKMNQNPVSLEGEALIKAAEDCELIVSYRQSPGPAQVFERLPRLVAFLRCAIDIRNIDVPAASKAGVLVTQASAGFITSVAEMVFGFMIDLSRGITRHSSTYHTHAIPKAVMGRELKGSTLGVIGYGAIGREVVRLGKAFGMRVLITDPYVADVQTVSLDQLLAESDYVVPLAVANEATENLMDQRAFGKMKKGAFFINVSRGNLVDEQALEVALDSGRLGGCAMDVGRAPEHQSMETVAQAAEIAKGRAPKGAVNAQHWKRKP
jgi:D-3-phosphoglycerate dehydrogenase